MNESNRPKPKLGISACLLGQNVRYDGAHKRDNFLTDTFGRFVEWVAVCPEVEVGMGVPRETLRLCRPAGGAQADCRALREGLDARDAPFCRCAHAATGRIKARRLRVQKELAELRRRTGARLRREEPAGTPRSRLIRRRVHGRISADACGRRRPLE
jgi:hypothetical protein